MREEIQPGVTFPDYEPPGVPAMDLRSGHAFWPTRDGSGRSYPALRRDLSCEVAIVGGGITGALIAHEMMESGLDTVLLEKRVVASGSTSASTALLLPELDTDLGRLIEFVGEANAVRCYELGVEAIEKLESLTTTLGDSCGFERRPSLYFASTPADAAELKREYELRRGFGMRLDLLSRPEIEARYSFSRAAALYSPIAAQVDPCRLTRQLIEHATARGARIHEHTNVIRYERAGGEGILVTGDDCRVRARRVIFATGYESARYLREQVGILGSTYAIVSQPIEHFSGWEDRCLIWETARPYLYLRTTADGRAMIGGGDEDLVEPGRRDVLLPEKCRFLQRQFEALFPAIAFEPALAWAGLFASTRDGLPYIGETEEYPGAYFALCYGGNGTTFGVIAAGIIRDLCLGRPNRDAAIFRFGR